MATQRGNFIWYDVMTSEPTAATSFYSDVIGWDAQEYRDGERAPLSEAEPLGEASKLFDPRPFEAARS
jgi:predicted enzyme related to lactoylglutathione lyase